MTSLQRRQIAFKLIAGTLAMLVMSTLAVIGWNAVRQPDAAERTVPLMAVDQRAAATTAAQPAEAFPLQQQLADRQPPTPVANPVVHAEAQAAAQPSEVAAASPIYDGRPIRPARTVSMRTTAYSPGPESCGEFADGITASGYSVWTNGMKLVAADTDVLPFGTLVSIPGYNNGRPVPVLDRGGAIRGNRLDLLYPTHQRALQWGVQDLEITVWEYAD
jgi:3D (Asp-Asp-Asp) domain-containing protein